MKSPTHDNDANHRADLYEKFNDFVRNRGISLSDFWKSWKVLVQPEEFRQYFSDIRFQINHDDYTSFLKEISSNDGVVMLELFAKKVPNWLPSIDAFKEEIKERALRVETQKRATSTQFRIKSGRPQTSSSVGNRPYSGNNGGVSRPYSGIRPISGVSTISYKSKGTQPSEYPLVTEHHLATDKTKHYLKKAKEREKEMEKLLNLAVMKGKNEKEYEALVKMGEANEISQSIGSTITYRAFRAADGTLRCHVYDLDKFVKEMTIEEMAREYKVIKQNQKLASNKPIWESLASATKSGAGLLPKDVIQKDKKKPGSPSPDKSAPQGGGDGKAKGNIDRKERQNEIKLVLAETMELTTILKYQLKILEKRGINLQGTNMSASMTKIGGSSLKNSGNV